MSITQADLDRTKWSTSLFQRMDWRSWERLCADIFRKVGWQVEETPTGADGGIDLVCRKGSVDFAVQCKREKGDITVRSVRELAGSMTALGYSRAVFMTTGAFNKRARQEFQPLSRIELIDGYCALDGIKELGSEFCHATLEKYVATEDWDHPTCPACDVKMVARESRRGRFWGCKNYGAKRCRLTFREEAFPLPED